MEDYSLALKKMAKFPKAFPEHPGNEEKAGEFSTQFASPNNKVLMFFPKSKVSSPRGARSAMGNMAGCLLAVT